VTRRGSLLAMAVLAMVAPPAPGQDVRSAYERGFELERRGNYVAAAEAYREVLRETAGDVEALLGLERVLYELGRPGEVAPWVSAALVLDPDNTVLYGAAVRSWAAAGEPDSVLRFIARWSALEPGSEAPWREWGFSALGRRDRAEARRAYQLGRAHLGRGDALAGELAQLATLDHDWPTAVAEWITAVQAVPGSRAGALSLLGQASLDQRPAVLAELDRHPDRAGAVIGAMLAARWGDPVGGQQRLARAHAQVDSAAARAFGEFLDELRAVSGPEAALARARTFELLASRPGPQAGRYLGDAARAYAEAGDRQAARRLLTRLSGAPAPGGDVATIAQSTLIGVLIAEERLDEAEWRLDTLRPAISMDEADQLTQRLVRGLLRAGRLDRAEAMLVADSSVEGLALRGRARLLRGDLAGASDYFAQAGPYALGRVDATDRVAILALLQVIDQDSVSGIGAAFQALERGDSAGAASGFEAAARRLPAERGGAELLLLAGRLREGTGALREAERLLRAAGDVAASAAAPAARLDLARVLQRSGRREEALVTLEQLILEHPTSAVAPQARRLADTIRGGVPGG
jgi:tetratricopeptide (TPR) repeat protein